MEQVRLIRTEELHFKEPSMADVCSPEVLASVRSSGVINPLLVADRGDQFVVYIGNQRLSAARELGIEELACHFVTSSADVRGALRNYHEVP